MIQAKSYLSVTDNTGVKKVMCINILGHKKYATIGDICIAVAKSTITNSNIKKSSIVRILIVRINKNIKRQDGSILKFDDNACILLNTSNNLIGTRIFGPIPFEIRDKFPKIASLALSIL